MWRLTAGSGERRLRAVSCPFEGPTPAAAQASLEVEANGPWWRVGTGFGAPCPNELLTVAPATKIVAGIGQAIAVPPGMEGSPGSTDQGAR